jgi:hypothetical protein
MLPKLLSDWLKVSMIKQDLELDTVYPDDGVIRIGLFGRLD